MKPLWDIGFFVLMALTLVFGAGVLLMLGMVVALAWGAVFVVMNAGPFMRRAFGMRQSDAQP